MAGETLFIADLHLSAQQPVTLARFLAFLRERAPRAARLYILGDLFETWIGDDDDLPPGPEVRAALRTLVEQGTSCVLLHGNRDFLIGRDFQRETGCVLAREPLLVHFDGERTLLMHGDRLCSDDHAYQRFRRRVRNPLVQWLFLRQPLERRRALAADYRLRGRAAVATKPDAIMDVNAETVAHTLHRFRASRLIHGHTHRPADHHLEIDGRGVERLVLADWTEARGEILVHHPGKWWRESLD